MHTLFVGEAMDVRSQVQMALQHIAATAGFHRLDAVFGCEQAEKEHLDLVEVVVGARLLRRYRQQVEALGIALPDEAVIINWAICHSQNNLAAKKAYFGRVIDSLTRIM